MYENRYSIAEDRNEIMRVTSHLLNQARYHDDMFLTGNQMKLNRNLETKRYRLRIAATITGRYVYVVYINASTWLWSSFQKLL